MRTLSKTIVFFVLLALVPVFVLAQSTGIDRIVKNGEIRIGMSGNQPPFTMKSKDGSLMGYEVDLAKMIAKGMNVELKLVEKPFVELLPALERGEIDAIMSGMTMTPERNLKVAFVGPYIISGKSILTKSATLAAADEADDINQSDISLAALTGSTSQNFVERLLPEVKLTTFDNYDAGVDLVLTDKVHAMIADFPICALSLLRHPEAGLATLAEPFTIEPIGIALPPNDPLLLNLIENYLGALDMVGILDELEIMWFEDGAWLVRLP
jgi:polar amino acid transport system substrate-binding protein